MINLNRPHARVHLGPTGKPGIHHKPVVRDEIGDIQLSVSIDATGRTRVDFGKPVTYIALPPDKAYDFANLVLEHVKDKQGGEPVNVTEEKIISALAHTLAVNGIGKKGGEPDRDLAAILVPEFMAQMAVDSGVVEEVVVSEIGHDAVAEAKP